MGLYNRVVFIVLNEQVNIDARDTEWLISEQDVVLKDNEEAVVIAFFFSWGGEKKRVIGHLTDNW